MLFALKRNMEIFELDEKRLKLSSAIRRFFLPRFFVFEKDFIFILSAKPPRNSTKVSLYSLEMSHILRTFCFKMEYRADFARKGCLSGPVHPDWLVACLLTF